MKRPINIVLKTQCANSQLNYQLTLEPGPEAAPAPPAPTKSKSGGGIDPVDLSDVLEPEAKAQAMDELLRTITEYHFLFLDSDGFRLFEVTLPTSELVRGIEKGGKSASLSANGTGGACAGNRYLRASSVELAWRSRK